ncbi:MAG: GTP-binding protein [Thermoprotei archaeon]|nr:MAG: GTP-binding protein [Thermoprotei archaeon]
MLSLSLEEVRVARKVYKIVVAGAFNSGKTTFVKSLCGKILNTDKRLFRDDERKIKETTTVAMDFGKVYINGKMLYVFGTPGQFRFCFMWDILSKGMDGFILLVDSSDLDSIKIAKFIYRHFKMYGNHPHVVGANKQDIKDSLTPAKIRDLLEVPQEIPVIPVISLRKDSVVEAVKVLLKEIEKKESSENS